MAEASEIMGISERQTVRVLKIIRDEGTKGIVHKLRGRKSNRGYLEQLKRKIITLYKQGYYDYEPMLYSKKLLEHHKISIDHETIKKWLRENAITTSIRRKRPYRKKRKKKLFGSIQQKICS